MIKFSVICPTYNSALFLSRTVNSVLSQKLAPHELIISDDGSSDNTVNLGRNLALNNISKTKIIVLENKHKGPGAARNSGILAASGDWIAFLDSDDLWCSRKLLVISKEIENNSSANFFCHNEYYESVTGKRKLLVYGKRYADRKPFPKQIYLANMFSTSAVTCKKSLLVDRGLFDETLMAVQDYELWIRLSPHIRPHFVEEFLGSYLEREGNITSTKIFLRFQNEFLIAKKYVYLAGPFSFARKLGRIVIAFSWEMLRKKTQVVVFKIQDIFNKKK